MRTMVADSERLERVFLWKQGDAPNFDYAKELLESINPDASRAISDDPSRLQLFTVTGPWPDDPWERAIADMDSVPAPTGTRWTDAANYDLAGWQGNDLRTGENLFLVSAYKRPGNPISHTDAPQEGKMTTTPPVAQTPYYPQYPTGPVSWPTQRFTSEQEEGEAQDGEGLTPPISSRYSPLHTGPIDSAAHLDTITGPLAEALRATLLDSYAPYYVGFGARLAAGLIDLFFTMIFPLVMLMALLLRGQSQGSNLPFGQYALVACLALIVFVAYHVIQVGLWGQTLGKVLTGIKVVAPDGGPPGFSRAMVRVLGYLFSFLLAGWGFLMIAFDPRRQALHDRFAETLVVPENLQRPVPAGLPGYPLISPRDESSSNRSAPVIAMAAIGAVEEADSAQLSTVPQLPNVNVYGNTSPPTTARSAAELLTAPPSPTPGLDTHSARVGQENRASVEKARALFKSGLSELEKGSAPAVRGYKVDPQLARVASSLLKDALELVPASVLYRYFYAVALRYAGGIEPALVEFRKVLDLDPTHFEAQKQVTYGSQWHDAFAYPAWVSPAPVEVGMTLPEAVTTLLPAGGEALTRMVLLREGGNKRTAFLSRTPTNAWSTPPSLDMQASLHMTLSRTPHGPILAVYVIMQDEGHEPYIGETFLNPREPVQTADDACQLGQHMLEQIARQDRTYFIFIDEENHLLLSRKVIFNTPTQVSIARCLYEVQSLPPQHLDPEAFVQAAQWHMQHVSLEQIKEQYRSESKQ